MINKCDVARGAKKIQIELEGLKSKGLAGSLWSSGEICRFGHSWLRPAVIFFYCMVDKSPVCGWGDQECEELIIMQ